jgi:hypothetical protein
MAVVAIGVAKQRGKTIRYVVAARCIVIERIITRSRVLIPSVLP